MLAWTIYLSFVGAVAVTVLPGNNPAVARVTISAVLAIKAREDRLLATINQTIPIPIKTSGSGFSRTSRNFM